MILSVLIPTMTSRRDKFNALKLRLDYLSAGHEVEILSIEDVGHKNGGLTTGEKRNKLVDMANGKYSVFIDDDDDVPDYYFEQIFNAINNNPETDCIGFKGMIYGYGQPCVFRHSVGLPYSPQKVKNEYLRPPNHLNPMLTDYFRAVRFPDRTFAEDYDFCLRLAESGLVKNEVFIDLVMYHYKYEHRK
jgi:GT2 family glycosyltransferase